MKTHEYQAKDLFSSYGIPVEKHELSGSVDEAVHAYERMGLPTVVVKAQVMTGGRGKAGGVKLARGREEVSQHANAILGMTIKDFTVEKILISEAVSISKEFYVSYVIDRNSKSVMLMLSPDGGMDIEKVALKTPDRIYKFPIDPLVGIPDFLARRYAFTLFNKMEQVNEAAEILQNLYRLFIEKDCSLTEINPLVQLDNGHLIAIDAKVTFDDNALYRHPHIAGMYEPSEEEKIEMQAKEKGFSYVRMEGSIGCMVNGAGLAMATMDMIKLYGGEPANFLDIGGSSNPNKVIEAMKLLLSDVQVQVVMINIFGGITRCDDVAHGLIKTFDEIKTDIPVVVRLTGTNEKQGRDILKDSRFIVAGTMAEAAHKAVSIIEG